MSNQAKFLISLLFIVAIILCAGLTRFYFDVTKNTGNTGDEGKISSVVRGYSNGMRVFESTNGYYGLLDEDGAIIIEPEWMEILTVTDQMALVYRRMNDEVLIGGIDFEENVVFPFAFHSMELIADHYYIGTVAEDESCIIYNKSFVPLFQESWEGASYENGVLRLEKNGCLFSYYVAEEEPIFRKAQMNCMIGEKTLSWNISNRIYLSELTPEELLRINNCVTSYIDMLLANTFSELPEISAPEYSPGLSKQDIFKDMVFDDIEDFSFSSSDREKKIYDFAFTIQYHADPAAQPATDTTEVMTEAEMEESVQVHLFFQRNDSNQLLLTSVDLDYHRVQAAPKNNND